MKRLLRPKSIAVVGGAWGASVVEQCLRMEYAGDIWPVHPNRAEVHGCRCYPTIEALPAAPDACFVGVNRNLTIDIITQLGHAGAGGAVCFASGFSESVAEDASGHDLQKALVDASGDMPIIGPNCYGLINYLDGALLWPDQHGGVRVSDGVAIITQSSNIAINMTMQQRGLPIAYVMTAGNQAKVSMADMALALLDDERVTAIGLHIEGFSHLSQWQAFALQAKQRGVGVVVIKAGQSEQARAGMISHTNSLSGTDASADALIARLGFARVDSIATFLEALKLLHINGPLNGFSVASMSCSGGEASLMADAFARQSLECKPLDEAQTQTLRTALGPMVALANPLDYHTYIWNDQKAMAAAFEAMLVTPADITFLVIDFPRGDRCEDQSWWVALDALLDAHATTGACVAVLASLPENLPVSAVEYLMQRGIAALGGIDDALSGVVAAAQIGLRRDQADAPILYAESSYENVDVLSEFQSKSLLKAAGLTVANARLIDSPEQAVFAALELGYPLVAKVSDVAHKSEHAGVVLNIVSEQALVDSVSELLQTSSRVLIEPFYAGAVTELLLGVVKQPEGFFTLTIGAGGIQTELLNDSFTVLLPVTREVLKDHIEKLRIAPIINGYRGGSAANMPAIIDTIIKLAAWVESRAEHVLEVEINPLLCFTDRVIISDALITSSNEQAEIL